MKSAKPNPFAKKPAGAKAPPKPPAKGGRPMPPWMGKKKMAAGGKVKC